MNKKCRIILYVLSIVMVAGCIAAVVRTKESTPEVKVPDEAPAAAVSGEDTEHANVSKSLFLFQLFSLYNVTFVFQR